MFLINQTIVRIPTYFYRKIYDALLEAIRTEKKLYFCIVTSSQTEDNAQFQHVKNILFSKYYLGTYRTFLETRDDNALIDYN